MKCDHSDRRDPLRTRLHPSYFQRKHAHTHEYRVTSNQTLYLMESVLCACVCVSTALRFSVAYGNVLPPTIPHLFPWYHSPPSLWSLSRWHSCLASLFTVPWWMRWPHLHNNLLEMGASEQKENHLNSGCPFELYEKSFVSHWGEKATFALQFIFISWYICFYCRKGSSTGCLRCWKLAQGLNAIMYS